MAGDGGGHNANGQSGSSKNDSEWCGYNTCGVYVWFSLLLRVILTRKTKDRQAESTRVRIRWRKCDTRMTDYKLTIDRIEIDYLESTDIDRVHT
jgi:hypothetical protein